MTTAGTVDPTLDDGMGTDAFLVLGAVVGGLGWLGTQYVAWNPGLALETVGLEGTTVIVLFWAVCTLSFVAIGTTIAARSVRYSPPMWVWGLLITCAFALNATVVWTSLVPQSMAPYALWHPWMVVYALGYVLTGIIATGRNRPAYLVASVAAVVVLLVALTFPLASRSWVFALTGAVHAGPLLIDAASSHTPHPAIDGTEEASENR